MRRDNTMDERSGHHVDGEEASCARNDMDTGLHREIVENAVVGIYITRIDGRIIYANETMWRMFGCDSREQFIAEGAERFYRYPHVRQELLNRIRAHGNITAEDIEIITKKGQARHLSISVSLLEDRMIGLALDITEQRLAEEALRQSEARYAQLAEQSRTVVWEVSLDGLYTYMSPSSFTLLGYRPEEIVGKKHFYDLCPDEDRERVKHFGMVDCMGKGMSFSNYENRLQAKSGQILWVMSSGLPLRDATGKIVGYRGIDMDITVRKRAEDRLQYLSTHDALTQASNRASFEEEVERLSRGRRYPVSVIVADINNLKAVNDNHGHAAGDQMLKCACQVLREAVRAEDRVARIGGDEFAVLLPLTDERTVCQMIDRVRRQLDQHNRRNGHFPLGMALGAATAQKGARLQDAVRSADEQMYVEKRRELGRTTGSECRS